MARVFDSDLLECPRCKSRMQVISFLQDTEAILEILKSLKMSIAPPDIYELEACFIEYEIDQVNGMAGEEIPHYTRPQNAFILQPVPVDLAKFYPMNKPSLRP